jgi:hypothetical protein
MSPLLELGIIDSKHNYSARIVVRTHVKEMSKWRKDT